MGMAGTFLRLSSEKLRDLQSEPSQVEELLGCLFTGRYSADSQSPGQICDIDKSWQTIHYLLTGNPWGGKTMEAQAILGGTEFGPDLGYGPARFLTSDQVQQVSDSISRVTREGLAMRFDGEAMESAGLYAFSSEYAEDELEMAQDYFDEMKKFYAAAAAEGDAVLLLIL